MQSLKLLYFHTVVNFSTQMEESKLTWLQSLKALLIKRVLWSNFFRGGGIREFFYLWIFCKSVTVLRKSSTLPTWLLQINVLSGHVSMYFKAFYRFFFNFTRFFYKYSLIYFFVVDNCFIFTHKIILHSKGREHAHCIKNIKSSFK